jgi:hypothetical protein
MAPSENCQETLQGMGRIVRLGQKETPIILILAISDSYDERLMARAEKKMMSILYFGREKQEFSEEEDASEVISAHKNCFLGTGTPADKANRLIVEQIFQTIVGTTRPYLYKMKMRHNELGLAFNACGHPPSWVKIAEYGIEDKTTGGDVFSTILP